MSVTQSPINLIRAELERRRRLRQHEEAPRYDWYGPDCGCPADARKEDGSCPEHPRARDKQRPPDGEWEVWLILAGRGFGKALSIETPIPTPRGWTTMGNLEVGDTVYDEKGYPTRVSFVSPVMIGNECYDVVFSDGSVITADGDHEWMTWTHAARKAHSRRIPVAAYAKGPSIQRHVDPRVVTTREILETLHHGNGKRIERNHSIPLAGPLENDRADLPVHPYVLGVWLGDGSNNGAVIASDDLEIVENVRKYGYEVRKHAAKFMYGVGSTPSSLDPSLRFKVTESLHSTLKGMGLFRNKHVPECYLRASAGQRQALLEGLMDTDGTISKGGSCCFDNTNPRLADAVEELAVSLGFKVTRATKRAMLNGKDCGISYRVMFTPNRRVFRLSRKFARQKLAGVRKTQKHRYIVDVRSRPSVAVRCIQVAANSHLFLAGRSCIPTHNTKTGIEWLRYNAEKMPGSRWALVGQQASDVRDILVEGESGLLAASPPWFMPVYQPSKRRITWPNGSMALCYSSEDPGSFRGPQFHGALCDEFAKWSYVEECWDNLQFGLRLGRNQNWIPRVCITTTPLPLPIIKSLKADPKTVYVKGSMFENAANLAKSFIATIKRKYEGTRLGRQEIEAEILEDTPGALWTTANLDAYRVDKAPDDIIRFVVAVDPSVADPKAIGRTDDSHLAEAGIVAGGLGEDGHVYVTDDNTIKGSPMDWGNAAINLYLSRMGDSIVAEANNGGALVSTLLQTIDNTIPVKLVYASKGKFTRAEPVASLYEQGRVHHVGGFPELEEELTGWVPGMKSPNRLDALVWLVTELILEGVPLTVGENPWPGWRG